MIDELLKGLYKLCNALEELKSYKDKPEGWLYTQAEQNGYNKAIEDFNCYVQHEESEGNIKSLDDYDRIANHLKKGCVNWNIQDM